MPDTKITALAAITTVDPAADVLPIVDISDTSMAASGTTKKITSNQILGAGGTATLASATITGDLTVRTNQLVVNATGVSTGGTPAGNFGFTTVGKTGGIFANKNAANQYLAFQMKNSTQDYAMFIDQDGVGSNSWSIFDNTNVQTAMRYYPGASGSWIHYINGSTAMTLNATGLGVGNTPVAALDVYKVANDTINRTNATFCFGQIAGLGAALLGQQSASAPYQFNLQAANAANSVQFPLVLQPSGGNVGIGVAPSAWNGSFKAIDIGSGCLVSQPGNQTAGIFANSFANGINYTRKALGTAAGYDIYNGAHYWLTAASGAAGSTFAFGDAKMTLDASGRLLVGVTSALASGNTFQNLGSARQVLTLKGDDQTSYTLGVWSASATGDNLFQYFATETTLTVRGGISYNRGGGLVAYNTTSDYRAKDIIGPVSNSGSLIDSLKVYVGKMKGATIERPMLIAHEAQEVAPYAVTGTKDEVDADGNPKYQQMDVSALVPVLIAEIQSLRARVQTLETR